MEVFSNGVEIELHFITVSPSIHINVIQSHRRRCIIVQGKGEKKVKVLRPKFNLIINSLPFISNFRFKNLSLN